MKSFYQFRESLEYVNKSINHGEFCDLLSDNVSIRSEFNKVKSDFKSIWNNFDIRSSLYFPTYVNTKSDICLSIRRYNDIGLYSIKIYKLPDDYYAVSEKILPEEIFNYYKCDEYKGMMNLLDERVEFFIKNYYKKIGNYHF